MNSEMNTVTRFLCSTVNLTEDALRSIGVHQHQVLYPLWKCRQWLTEGRTRRLLRKAVRAWHKSTSLQSEDYFRGDELGINLDGRMITVAIRYRPAD